MLFYIVYRASVTEFFISMSMRVSISHLNELLSCHVYTIPHSLAPLLLKCKFKDYYLNIVSLALG